MEGQKYSEATSVIYSAKVTSWTCVKKKKNAQFTLEVSDF